jgi:enoyl-CoA hydratase/carnithine racemase
MNPERVTVTVTDHVADVRLTRGDKHNAIDYDMFESLHEAGMMLAGDPTIRAAVVSGEGSSFCAGLDFPSVMAAGPRTDWFDPVDGSPANMFQRAGYGFQEAPIPVIGALHGHCIGGGSQIALAMDIRIAAPDTKICVKEIQYGLIPDMGISQSLPRLVSMDVAKELVWTGRTVEAEEAHKLGLVTRISESPREDALELARQIAARNPDAIRSAKRLIEESWSAPAPLGLKLEADLQQAIIGTPNQMAAVTAAFSNEPAEFEDPES